jgi:transcriptional regulator with GAF, ATPase, and Fis domain
LKDQLSKEKLYLEDEIRSEINFAQIVGKSAPLRRVLQQVETVAPTDSTVLIKVLNECNWVVAGPNGAAAHLAIKRSTQLRMQKLGIARNSA